jgi:hypothetical protein
MLTHAMAVDEYRKYEQIYNVKSIANKIFPGAIYFHQILFK